MNRRDWKGKYECLKFPVQKDACEICLEIREGTQAPVKMQICFARTRIDEWELLILSGASDICVSTEAPVQLGLICACRTLETAYEELYGKRRQIFHFLSEHAADELKSICRKDGEWLLEYTDESRKGVRMQARSRDLVNWKSGRILCRHADNLEKYASGRIKGDIKQLYLYENEGKRLILGLGRKMEIQGRQGNLFLMPVTPGDSAAPAVDLDRLRIWKREWERTAVSSAFKEMLRFRIAPGIWPNIRILPPENKRDDISAEAYEIELRLNPGQAERVEICVCGLKIAWLRRTEELLYSSGAVMEWPAQDGAFFLRGYIDKNGAEFFGRGNLLFLQREGANAAAPVDNVSGNLGKCRLEKAEGEELCIRAAGKEAVLEKLTVYGLRKQRYGLEALQVIDALSDSRLLYKERHFCIYDNRVSDTGYGKPDAYVPDGSSILSLPRAVEEFCWRDNGQGDMVRALGNSESWHPAYEILQYPRLTTGIPVIDASYRLALDTFRLCSSREYALPGQEDMWSAGAFQGRGQGFGVWMRDSAHIAVRCGNLIDPSTARRTLLYAAEKGFDNGCDGPAVAIVGFWDYYRATGDLAAVMEAWGILVEDVRQIDRYYQAEQGLAAALQSTSNDAFPEPECGGFCLGTEVYCMKAYEAMADFGRKIGYEEKEVLDWQARGSRMRRSIKEKYWNPDFGYYTSGPEGSEAFQKGYWETAGAEGVLWDKFGLADEQQKREMLRRMEDVAMTEYGVLLFPYRPEKHHYCGTIWGVWNAGIAAAAGETGMEELVYKLLFQQIRSCIMNKTFYEVIEGDTGKAWRWPAQLWHAAGFLSIIYYGILGLSYDEEGLRFRPMLRKEWENTSIENLRYRNSRLSVSCRGYGRLERMYLDGKEAEYIPPTLHGEHRVTLVLNAGECKGDC